MRKQTSLNIAFSKLAQFLDTLAMIIFAGLILLVIAHVLMRDLFSKPILGTFDIVSLFIGTVVVFALGRCALENGHVAIDFILDRFPSRLQKYVDITVTSFTLVLFAFFSYHLSKYAYSMYLVREVSLTIKIPVYPFIYAVAVGLLLTCLVMLLQLIERIRGV